GVIGDLAELSQTTKQRKLLRAPSSAGEFSDDFFPVIGLYLLIHLLLLWGHVGIFHADELFRQIFRHLGFQSSKDERLDHCVEATCLLPVVLFFDREEILLLKE